MKIEHSSHLLTGFFLASSTNTEIEYKILVPNTIQADRPLPLVLHLHGASSSAKSLEIAAPAYDLAWESGELPPAVIACASTPTLGGFYIDHVDGPRWESLVSVELPRYLANHYNLSARCAVIGASMGGYGALKIALRNPSGFVAVAALSPAIFLLPRRVREFRRAISRLYSTS